MKEYVEIINRIKNTSGRLDKEAILEINKNNEGFKTIMKFVFDPMITTGLAKKKIEKVFFRPEVYTVRTRNLFDIMEFLKVNPTGTSSIIMMVQDFLATLETDEEKELATAIFTKDMPIGVSASTLNNVYGKKFITKYGVMLASKYEDHMEKIKGEFAVTLKLDGMRATFFNHKDGVIAYSRAGKFMDGFPELESAFKSLPTGYAYDGELVCENPLGLPAKDLFRETMSVCRSKGIKTGVNFVMFDHLPIEEFDAGISKKDYGTRMNEMGSLFEMCIPSKSPIKKVPTYYIGEDQSVIPGLLRGVIAEGLEGLMVSPCSGMYQTKRVRTLLKVKEFYNIDLIVLDVVEHVRGNLLGSVIVDYKGYKVQVGSGFTKPEQDYYWKNRDQIIGKIIEVQYFEETTNAKDDSLSLRFPTFVQIRSDKDDVSYD